MLPWPPATWTLCLVLSPLRNALSVTPGGYLMADTLSAGVWLNGARPRATMPSRNALAHVAVRFQTVSSVSSRIIFKLVACAPTSVLAGVNGVSPSSMLLRYFVRSK